MMDPFHGKRAAVSLTYDDALQGHWRQVAPALEAAGLRGTFNVLPRPAFMESLEPWRRAAAAGHELGNHSLFHPCRKEPVGAMDWVKDDFDLRRYSPHRWREEMRIASALLQLVDGRTQRTYANTCCNTAVGMGDQTTELGPIIAEMFVAGRGPLNHTLVDPSQPDFGGLGHFSGDARSFEQLRDIIEQAIDRGGWAIFMFHGVGDEEHRLHIKPPEHERLVAYLSEMRDTVWTAPMVDVAAKLRDRHAA